MYQIVSLQNKNEWDQIINSFENKDVYFMSDYCALYETLGDGIPHLFFYQDESGSMVANIFLKRKIDLPFWNKNHSDEIYYDIMTPYGYGGPLVQNGNEKVIRVFRRKFEHYCKKENIVTEFVRFHPLLQNHQYLDGLMDTSLNRKTIYIDLTKEDVQSSYHKNHLRNIKKAIKHNLIFKVLKKESALEIVDEFYELYKETMEKLNASHYYYFSIDYMKSIFSKLGDQSMIAAVYSDELLIGAALCLYEKGYLHYHLGCSKKDYLNLGTNVFLFQHISMWGKENGFHTFHLGGGYVGEDSLFQFKQRFNPDGETEFFIGKKVHDEQIYRTLITQWEKYYSQKVADGFFPAYRSKPTNREVDK